MGGCESGDNGGGFPAQTFTCSPGFHIGMGRERRGTPVLAIAGWDTYLTVTNILLFSQNYLKIVFEHEDAH